MNKKNQLFVQEYLKDLNATKAAIRAGYSHKTAGQIGDKLLKKAEISQALQSAFQKRSIRTQTTQDRVIEELKAIAFSGMKDVARWNASGVELKDSNEISPEAAASVQVVEETTNQHGGSLKIKQHDKLRALELLGRHLGMWDSSSAAAQPEDRPLKEASDAELQKALGGM